MNHILQFSKLAASSNGPGSRDSKLPDDLVGYLPPGMIVGQLSHAVETAMKVANSSASVLVTGESGTGKELISQIIHNAGSRREGPNVCVNCAALPESLIESELFGHRRGSFTGADTDRAGCFEIAQGGTLLLDEISEIPVTIQAKLLRVLETGILNRVGSNDPVRLDVRIVATSNRALESEVEQGRFRLDLLHRLKVIQIELPPLRERIEDIQYLADHFVSLFAHEASRPIAGLEPPAINRLKKHSWPGNIRELRNVIHRACILANGPRISLTDLGSFDQPLPNPGKQPCGIAGMTLAELEKMAILDAIDRNKGCRTAAAKQLGISPRTIFNKILLYEQARPDGGSHANRIAPESSTGDVAALRIA